MLGASSSTAAAIPVVELAMEEAVPPVGDKVSPGLHLSSSQKPNRVARTNTAIYDSE